MADPSGKFLILSAIITCTVNSWRCVGSPSYFLPMQSPFSQAMARREERHAEVARRARRRSKIMCLSGFLF